ncbi:MAG: hypothetical protein U5N86_03625 [Planctomycetota bacterium]|nr:hypothetical protein [Planctomycetota bacterium]
MIRKYAVALVAITILLLCCRPAGTSAQTDITLADIVPRSTLFYAGTDDFPACFGKASDCSLMRILNSAQMKELMQASPESAGSYALFTETYAQIKSKMMLASTFLEGPAALAVTDVEKGPAMVMWFALKDNTDPLAFTAASKIEKFIEGKLEASGTKLNARTVQLAGVPARIVALGDLASDEDALCYAAHSGNFFISLGRSTLENTLNSLDAPPLDSLRQFQSYSSAKNRNSEFDFFWFFNFSYYHYLAPGNGQNMDPMTMFATDMAPYVDSIAGGVSVKPEDGAVVERADVNFLTENTGYFPFKLFSDEPCSYEAAKFFPTETISTIFANLNTTAIRDDFLFGDPRLVQMLDPMLQQNGLSRHLIASALSGEIAMYSGIDDDGQDGVFAARIGDENAMKRLINAVLGNFNEDDIMTSRYKDVDIHVMKGAAPGLHTAMCIYNGYLLSGMHDSVKRAMDRGENNLYQSEKFREMRKKMELDGSQFFLNFDVPAMVNSPLMDTFKKGFASGFSATSGMTPPDISKELVEMVTPQTVSFARAKGRATLKSSGIFNFISFIAFAMVMAKGEQAAAANPAATPF